MAHASSPGAAQLERAVAVLLAGGLVAFPTETVYGLGADAESAAAVAAIFRAKGRPASHPLIVHIAAADAAASWAAAIPAAAQALMDRFWPGPLTLVLPRSRRAGDAVTGGQDTVALRCPAHPWAQALLHAFCAARQDPAAALAAPSANRYGRISPTCAAHVRADLGEKPAGLVDLILDGGPCTLGIESTIVDFASGAARVLRPGSIRADQLRAALGADVRVAAPGEAAPRAPGRVISHYAPAKPLHLVPPADLPARITAIGAHDVGLLGPATLGVNTKLLALFIPAPNDAATYAHELYANLHHLDASPARTLLVAVPPATPDWLAIQDRLTRAATREPGPITDAD